MTGPCARQRQALLVLVVLAWSAGTCVRFATLGRQSLWNDEAFSWLAAQERASPGALLERRIDAVHPPVYYLSLRGALRLLGADDERALRTLSAVSSALALAVLAVAAWRWFDPFAALVSTAAAALSPLDLYFAQEARMYALLGLVWIVSAVALVEARETRRGSGLAAAAWCVATPLLPWVHYVGVLPALPLAALGVWLGWRLRRRALWIGGALAAASAAAAVLVGFGVRRAGGAEVAELGDLPELLRLWMAGPGAAPDRFAGYGLAFGWSPFVLGPASLAVAALVAVGARRAATAVRWMAALGGLVPPLALFAVAWLGGLRLWAAKPFLGPLYLFLLLLGAGVAALTASWSPRWRAAALGGLVLFWGLASRPYLTTWVKSDARAAAAALPARLAEDEAVWLPVAYGRELLRYYRRDLPRSVAPASRSPDTRKVSVFAAGEREPRVVSCDSRRIAPLHRLYIFPMGLHGRSMRTVLPCLGAVETLRFDGGRWVPAS